MDEILVTGAGGLLGSKIIGKAKMNHIVYPTHATRPFSPRSIHMDITDKAEVKSVLSKIKPDVVIHTAAETNVDKCETEKEHAMKVNAEGTKALAETCRKIRAKIVYVSTDYVFNGRKGLYTEDDAPNPVNYYGLTKLKGEQYVRNLSNNFVIVRTSVLYDAHPKKLNFAKWVIEQLTEKKTITVVEDHYNSPTLAANLADAILEIVENGLKGLYHTAGCERISRYGFALRIAHVFNLDESLIKPIGMDELKNWIAKRPQDSSLCVGKVQREIQTELLNVEQSLNEMKEKWLKTK